MTAEEKPRRCGNCAYWKRSAHSEELGECRANPPQVVVYVYTDVEAFDRIVSQKYAEWPETHTSAACGRWCRG